MIMLWGGEMLWGRRHSVWEAEMFEKCLRAGMKQWKERKSRRGLTYKRSTSGNKPRPLNLATCTLIKRYGETSLRRTLHVLSLIRHVGRHGRSFSLFAKISYSSSLGGLCTGQTSDIDIRHWHQTSMVWSRCWAM